MHLWRKYDKFRFVHAFPLSDVVTRVKLLNEHQSSELVRMAHAAVRPGTMLVETIPSKGMEHYTHCTVLYCTISANKKLAIDVYEGLTTS